MADKQVTRMEVDGSIVKIEAIDREVAYRYSDGSPSYRQRSLYKVLVDDVHRGYLSFPLGYGGRWVAVTLRPKNSYSPYFKQTDEQRDEYGLIAYYRVASPGILAETENWGEYPKHWTDRNAILAAFPRMVALGRAPSREEEIANRIEAKADFEERLRKDAEDDARRTREREERERQRVLAATAAEEARQETLAGLESIRDRFAGQLTNLEALALGRAIDAVTR